MSIRRAIPIVVTEDPAGTRAFYEEFLGFRVGFEQTGFLMLVSPSEPTTQVIVAWDAEGAMDPSVQRIDIRSRSRTSTRPTRTRLPAASTSSTR